MANSLAELLHQGLHGRRVFVRADLNAPLGESESGAKVVRDATRLRAAKPTLQKLRAAGARTVLASHLGRPKGETTAALSLRPVAKSLQELLGAEIRFCNSSHGAAAVAAAAQLQPGEIVLLENLRFHPGETQNSPALSRAYAALADAYVNDAFGTAHRAHASTAGVAAQFPPAKRAMGECMRTELAALQRIRRPLRPLLALIGGAKVSDKLATLQRLARHADMLCIGGAMAYTFLQAQGKAVGASLVENARAADAAGVLAAAAQSGCEVLLPSDHVIAKELQANAPVQICGEEIPAGFMGCDIGPQTAARYAAAAQRAETIFWNGPMGVFELQNFTAGTEAVAKGVAASGAYSVVGGGDSLAAVHKLGLAAGLGHLCTGGGAALEYVQGRALPGLRALEA